MHSVSLLYLHAQATVEQYDQYRFLWLQNQNETFEAFLAGHLEPNAKREQVVQSRAQDLVSRTRPTTVTSGGQLTRPASSAASSEAQSRPSTTQSTPTRHGRASSSPSRTSHSRHHGAHLAALDEDTQQQLLRHAEQDFLRSRKHPANTTSASSGIAASADDGLAAFASPRQIDAQRENLPSLYEFETEIEIYRV